MDPFVDGLKDLYETAMLAVAASRDPNQVSCPHVPYVGSNYRCAPVKILYVGKATYGWPRPPLTLRQVLDSKAPFRKVAELSRQFIENSVLPFYAGERTPSTYHSLFWCRIYKVTTGLLSKPEACIPDIGYDEGDSALTFRSIRVSPPLRRKEFIF